MYIYICIYVYVYMYIYIYTEGCAVGPGFGKQHFHHMLMSWEVYSDPTSLLYTYVFICVYIYTHM